MLSLINFKTIFSSWGRTKEEDKILFDAELVKLKYIDGSLYWED